MRIWHLYLAALLSLCACRKSEPAPAGPASAVPELKPVALAQPVAVTEIEPNDFQRAQLIPSRAIVSGTIAPPRPRSSDEDWYRVAPGPGVLLALSLELKGAQPMELSVYDRDRNRLLRQGSGPGPAVGSDTARVPAVGCSEACFVVVSGAVAGPYTLTVLGAPPEMGRELEPNGRAVDANELSLGKPMQGTLAAGDDEDWYRLQLAAPQPGQFLRIEVSGVASVRPELEVRALGDGALLATFRAAGEGEAIFVRDLALGLGSAGDARASDAGAQDAGAQDAGLVGAAARGVSAQPGGAWDLGAQDAGAQAGRGDLLAQDAGGPGATDPSGRAVEAAGRAATPSNAPASTPPAATPPPPDAPAATSALDAGAAPATDAQAAAAAAPPGQPAQPAAAQTAQAGPPTLQVAPPAPPPPAGYYLVLKPGFLPAAGKAKAVRGHNPSVPYTLLASLESGQADLEREPNDDLAHASDLSSRGTATGYLAPAGDVDWYRVHAESPMVLRAEVTGLERADLELSAWSPPARPGDKPTLLARANEGGVKEGEVLPAVGVPAGDSYLKVESALRQLDGKWVRDGEDRAGSYQLRTALVPDDGSLEREPNNDPASAQPISLPADLKGYLWPHRDLDVFRFHVGPDHAPISVHLGAVRGLDLALRLFELKTGPGGKLSAEVIGSADAVHGEGEEQLLEVPVREGDYAIEVASPRGKDASATLQYRLTIQ